jgi:hypothetical protein
MVGPECIKPFVLDPDPLVAAHACEYFAKGFVRDPEVLPMVLRSAEQKPAENRLHLFAMAAALPVSDPAVDLILEWLARKIDHIAEYRLNRMLMGAPVEVLDARAEDLRHAPGVKAEVFERLTQRREFATMAGEELWSRLRRFARQSDATAQYVGEIDQGYADDLVETLARHAVPDDDTLCRLLADTHDDGSWLEIFLVDLAGHRRVACAVPALVAKYTIDTDYLLERTTEALVRINDPEAASLVHRAFPTASWTYRLFSSSVLGRIRHPAAEDALLDLMAQREDSEEQTWLALSLCHLYSERGVDAVVRLIHDGYDQMYCSLEEELLGILPVLGIKLPEMATWRREIQEAERERARRCAERDAIAKRARVVPRHDKLSARPLPAPRSETAPGPPDRVGRNDPCPCGSGRKFKHCCMRKHS